MKWLQFYFFINLFDYLLAWCCLFTTWISVQTVCLQAPLGQIAKQTLPLKNAGNIDVLLRLKVPDHELYFLTQLYVSYIDYK